MAKSSRIVRSLLFVIALCGLLWANHAKYLSRIDVPSDYKLTFALGGEAPDFTLRSVTGQPVTLSSLRGEPVVIDFWASWCQPCLRQFEQLEDLDSDLRDKFRLVAVNSEESKETVQAFLAQTPLSATVVCDTDGDITARYGVEILPTTIFLDSEGRARLIHTGRLSNPEKFIRTGLNVMESQ